MLLRSAGRGRGHLEARKKGTLEDTGVANLVDGDGIIKIMPVESEILRFFSSPFFFLDVEVGWVFR